MAPRTIVVIGGANGGPTAAARAREFDEAARAVRGLSDDFSRRWPLAGTRGPQVGMGPAARGEFASDEEDLSRGGGG
jgi:hypothetical protein